MIFDGGRENEGVQQSKYPSGKNTKEKHDAVGAETWYDFLRNYPVCFQRQKAIGNYIVDFYCAKAKLVIELDGGGHYTAEKTEKDKLRTNELEAMNLTVLRVCNLDVDRNFSSVCEYIDLTVKGSLPQSASLTAPSSEGAFGSVVSEEQAKPGLWW